MATSYEALQRADHSLRFLHCWDILVKDSVCFLLHWAGFAACPPGWHHCQSRFSLGHPVSQQLVWHLEEENANLRFLIHDRDSKFTDAFDNVFKSTGFRVIHTPPQAPDANAYAERWVRTVREEFLDHLLIMNQTHLKRVLDSYINYYETSRLHQGLDQQTPIPKERIPYSGQVRKRDVLGGIINDYYCAPQPFSHSLNWSDPLAIEYPFPALRHGCDFGHRSVGHNSNLSCSFRPKSLIELISRTVLTLIKVIQFKIR